MPANPVKTCLENLEFVIFFTFDINLIYIFSKNVLEIFLAHVFMMFRNVLRFENISTWCKVASQGITESF